MLLNPASIFTLQLLVPTRGGHVHIARPVTNVHRNEYCGRIVSDAELFRTVADGNTRGRIEASRHVIVAALAISQLLLQSEELLARKSSGTTRCGASPRACRTIRRWNRLRLQT